GAPADNDLAWHVRSVIDVGEGASLKLVEHHVASDAHAHLGTQVVDTVVRESARLDWTLVQQAAPGAVLVRRHALHQHAHSQVTLHALELGGKLARNDVDVELKGDG